jgi:hypothetical protein
VSDEEGDQPSGGIRGSFLMDSNGFVGEMRDPEISFTWRILEVTSAANLSCLAKERCIPSFAQFRHLATVI